MEKELKLTLEKAQDTYKNGTPEHKKLLIDLYGKENFLLDITERVFDYASACEELGLTPLTINHFTFLPEEDQNRAFVRHQLTIQTRALRGDWTPNFKDSTYKYYNYFYWDTAKNGFSSYVYYYYLVSSVGSDLLFPNEKLADYARNTFEKQYIAYHF